MVDGLGSVGPRIEHPNVENTFEQVVARQEEQDKTEDFIEGSEETEDDPIGQPDLWFFLRFFIDGLTGGIGTLKDM